MKWIRTYTGSEAETLGCGRAIVWDPGHCQPFYLTDFNYLPLFEAAADDLAVLEWDIALSAEDRARFAGHIAAAPGLVHVAPYRHYQFKDETVAYGWVHRNADALSIAEGDPGCMYFGFGCVYLPLWLIRAYLTEMAAAPRDLLNLTRPVTAAAGLATRYVTDVTFSSWHWAATGHTVPVHWDVRPVHLNYAV